MKTSVGKELFRIIKSIKKGYSPSKILRVEIFSRREEKTVFQGFPYLPCGQHNQKSAWNVLFSHKVQPSQPARVGNTCAVWVGIIVVDANLGERPGRPGTFAVGSISAWRNTLVLGSPDKMKKNPWLCSNLVSSGSGGYVSQAWYARKTSNKLQDCKHSAHTSKSECRLDVTAVSAWTRLPLKTLVANRLFGWPCCWSCKKAPLLFKTSTSLLSLWVDHNIHYLSCFFGLLPLFFGWISAP